MKRYLLAFITVILISGLSGFVLDFLSPNFYGPDTNPDTVMAVIAVSSSIVAFAGFAAGAFVFGRGALLPGVAFYLAALIFSTRIVQKIALVVDPGITLVDVITNNGLTLACSLASCVMGLMLGERLRMQRDIAAT